MGTVAKYKSPSGVEGYLVRDSWTDPVTGERRHAKRRFQASKYGGLKRAKAEADAWLAQRESDRSRGVIWEPSRETLGSLLDRWAKDLGPPLAGATIIQYRSTVRNRFLPAERAWRVGELTTAHVQRLVTRWEREELSAETIAHAWKALRLALKLARNEKGILHDPMQGVRRRARAPKPLETWTPEQVGAFLDATRDDVRFGHVWALMFATCCRIGEVCALRWDDIDFTSGVVVIRRSWSGGVGKQARHAITERTKTGDVRRVPIPADLVAQLLRARMRSQSEWVAAGVRGPLRPDLVRAAWNAAIAKAGLPHITPHGARHTGATIMIAAGVSVPVVARILGHRDPAMTMRRYVHPDELSGKDAAEVLGALYRGETNLAGARSAPKVAPITENSG